MEYKTEKQLSARNLWGYSLGAIPAGLLVFIFSLKYIEYFYDKLQLNPIFFITGQVIYMVINAFNDPLLGQLSDKTNRERWKSRRIIYIKYGAPLWIFSFLLVWIPWDFENQITIFFHYVISICLFDTFFTLVVLVWMALLPEMTSDLDERNKGNFFALLVGSLVVIPFLLILGDMDPTSTEYLFLMIIVAILSIILLWLTAYLCEEKPEFQKDRPPSLWIAVRETVKSKPFLIYIGYIFCNAFLGSIGLSYLFAYLFILGEGGLLYYFIIIIIVGYSSNMICIKLRPKWGMRKIMLNFGIIKVFGTFVLFLIVLFFDNSTLTILGLTVLTFFGGYTIFNTPLLYLSVDKDELEHGSRREGMFLGINALFHKPAQSIGPIIATVILTTFGFVQGADIQPASAIIGIKVLMFLVPILVSTIGLIFIYFYPLHGDILEKLQEDLRIIHSEKREKLK